MLWYCSSDKENVLSDEDKVRQESGRKTPDGDVFREEDEEVVEKDRSEKSEKDADDESIDENGNLSLVRKLARYSICCFRVT